MGQVTPLFAQRLVPAKSRTRLVVAEEPDVPKFWGYTRVSGQGQAGNTSTETQPEKIVEEYKKNWQDTHDMGEVVHDVKSASKNRFDQRPGGMSLLSRMRKGDVLAITKVDRFSRSVVDGLQEMRDIWRKGITVVCLDMGGNKITFDTMTGQAFFFMLLFTAEMESKRKSERAKEAWDQHRKNGTIKARRFGGQRRYGLKMRGGKQVPAPEWREFTRKLMALYLFAVETFGYTKCDARHGSLAKQYGLTWWPNYWKSAAGSKEVLTAVRYLRWFLTESKMQEEEGKTYTVDEPWRRDHATGQLHPAPPSWQQDWMTPLNPESVP